MFDPCQVSEAVKMPPTDHPEASGQPGTSTQFETDLPQLEAPTISTPHLDTASQLGLETVPPDSKSETSALPKPQPSSQLFDTSSQYEHVSKGVRQQRAVDAVTHLHLLRFDDKDSATSWPSITNSQTPIAQVAPGLESEGTLAPSGGELDSTPGQRHDPDASFLSTYVPEGKPATKYFYLNEEKQVAQDLERVVGSPPQSYILGLRPKNFYVILVIAVVALTATIVGAIFGAQKSQKNQADHVVLDPMEIQSSTKVHVFPTPTFTSYPLETGPWEIKEPIDVEEGICAPHPQAIDRCENPYEYKFNIFKDSVGFKIQTDLGVLNNKYLYPPKTPDGMYSFNVTDWEMESSGELAPATCKTIVDAYFMLAQNYRFHLIFHYSIKKRCELWSGYVAEPGQFCHCEWMGYVYDDFKAPDQTTAPKETPSEKPIKSLPIIRSSTKLKPLSIVMDSTVVEALTSTASKTSIVGATGTPTITIVKVQPTVNTKGSTLTLASPPPAITASSQ